MGILRNSIEVLGIASEDELPKQINGQLIEYSETDYIYVPENMPLIYNITKADIKVNIKDSRTIDAPTGRIIIIDGIKQFNITYRPAGYFQGNYILKLNHPFNTFIDIPNNALDIKSMDIYIIDAYFKLMNSRKIYSFIVYMVNAVYENAAENIIYKDSNMKMKNLDQFDNEQ